MPGQINVDTTNETVTLEFFDDHNDATDAPVGATVAFTSSDQSVATVAVDASNPLVGDITPLKVGSTDIGATVSGANAPDGKPFSVSPVAVTVSAGPASTAGLVLSV